MKYSREAERTLLFPTSTAAPCGFLLTLRTRRNDACRITCRRRCSLRRNPKLNLQLRQTTSVNNHDASSIDATCIHKIVLRSTCSCLAFGVATAISDYVAGGSRLLLQLHREIVEAGPLIVGPNGPGLLQLSRPTRWCG